MNLRRFLVVGALGAVAAAWTAACQGPDEFFRNGGQVGPGSGGQMGASGGGPGSGGALGTGGIRAGTGGSPVISTGGLSGGTGGAPGTGGRVSTGGMTGTGGAVVSTGGVRGTGGVVGGTGGTTGGGGSGAANCAVAIQNAGYSAGSAPPCSACKENSSDKSMNCENVIDCLATHYPCGSANNCALGCNNAGAADGVVTQCVNAILTAGNCVQP